MVSGLCSLGGGGYPSTQAEHQPRGQAPGISPSFTHHSRLWAPLTSVPGGKAVLACGDVLAPRCAPAPAWSHFCKEELIYQIHPECLGNGLAVKLMRKDGRSAEAML